MAFAMAFKKKAPPAPPPAPMPEPADDGPDDSEQGETCHITAEQLQELNETGATQSDDGETITADIGGSETAGADSGEDMA